MTIDRAMGRLVIAFLFVAGLFGNFAESYSGARIVERNYGCTPGKVLHDLCASGEQGFFFNAAVWITIMIIAALWNERRSIS